MNTNITNTSFCFMLLIIKTHASPSTMPIGHLPTFYLFRLFLYYDSLCLKYLATSFFRSDLSQGLFLNVLSKSLSVTYMWFTPGYHPVPLFHFRGENVYLHMHSFLSSLKYKLHEAWDIICLVCYHISLAKCNDYSWTMATHDRCSIITC